MTLIATGLTDIGTRRVSNQDAIAWHTCPDGTRALGIVADGMGGYKGGEIASQVAVNVITQALAPLVNQPPMDDDSRVDAIRNAVRDANEQIQALREEDPVLGNMGTTVVLAWIQGSDALVAHIGDSRCYHLDGTRLTLKTRDDTVVQNMIDDGSIDASEAPRMPFRNVLTQALGSSETAEPTFCRLQMAPGDRLLLCSDGLTEAVPEADWPHLMQPQTPLRQQADALVHISLENQAADNVSVVLILKES
ncbi:serine/threonine-protein phosphatase [Marinobacter halodurans]|uniref:Serine/threonine-protein phosphatase n=1 Tax=Marinobacter halodurans TaxID=2528979 RepID=A0ABY1ZR59_9GAMM|nr:protein phosphatase 2C domain-containing protein [Marinobacter halodurans]TBW59607.1 serine/threonine-protein phosphatase [Marinobacter halodurans]